MPNADYCSDNKHAQRPLRRLLSRFAVLSLISIAVANIILGIIIMSIYRPAHGSIMWRGYGSALLSCDEKSYDRLSYQKLYYFSIIRRAEIINRYTVPGLRFRRTVYRWSRALRYRFVRFGTITPEWDKELCSMPLYYIESFYSPR